MRKFILAFCALFFAASAQAHVSAVPFPEVGSLQDAHEAAFAIFQTYLPPATPQITCNIVTGAASVAGPCASPAASCNGNVQTVTLTVTNTGNNQVVFGSNQFSSPGDVGKYLLIPGIGEGFITVVGAFSGTQTLTFDRVFNTSTVTGASKAVTYGSDDSAAFKSFNTWAVANQGSNQVLLNLPAGSNCWMGSIQGYSNGVGNLFNDFVVNIKNVLVDGNGTSTINGVSGNGLYVGSFAQCGVPIADVAGCSARIQTVSAGSSTVQLTAASLASGYISRFSATPGAIGNWILVGGLNPQAVNGGGSGFPANLTYFEWRRITALNAGTGVITLDASLTNSYLDTWPFYTNGTDADPGGPATIYSLPDAWNTTVEFRNITIKTDGSLNGAGRFITFRNVSFNGSVPVGASNNCGPFPSQNDTFAAYNTDWTYCTIESDKLATNTIFNVANANRLDFQSSSITNLTMTNSTITSFLGTPRFSTITDTSITNFRPGSNGYGNSTQLVCTRCAVTTYDNSGGIGQGNLTDYSKVATVLQFLNSVNINTGPPSRVFAPVGANNSNIFYVVGGSFSGTIGLFTANALSQDPTNTFAQTTDSVAFPPPFTSGSGAVCCTQITTHPMPKFTCDACTGDPTFVAMNIQNGATPLKPVAEFSKRSYAPVASGDVGDLLARGRIVKLTIDVTTASTSSGSLALNPTGAFHQETVNQSTWAPYDWVPTINLKQAGKREITPSGTTCDGVAGPGPGGSCAGDTCNLPASGCFVLPAAVWIKERLSPNASGTFNGTNPQFAITIQTDQGVVP